MLKKSITFDDLDGNPVTEDFYFNLTKAEIAEMELGQEGGLAQHLKRIVKSRNQSEILATFKMIILKTVGRRSEDGRRFIKSQAIQDDFAQTDAYSVLFMELVTNAAAATEFIRGVIPQALSEKVDIPEVARAMADSGVGIAELPEFPMSNVRTMPELPYPPEIPTVIAPPKHFNEYTEEEVLAMTNAEFDALAGTDPQKMSRNTLMLAMRRKMGGI